MSLLQIKGISIERQLLVLPEATSVEGILLFTMDATMDERKLVPAVAMKPPCLPATQALVGHRNGSSLRTASDMPIHRMRFPDGTERLGTKLTFLMYSDRI